MKALLFALAMACASMFTGCISQKAGAGLGARVFESILDVALQPAFDLQYASNEFRVEKQRWPQDYDELSSFLKQTDDTMYSSLQAADFHRIKFTETTEGNLRIDADFTLNSSGKLSGGGTYRVENSKCSIDGMEISPCDPQEMRLPRKPKQGA